MSNRFLIVLAGAAAAIVAAALVVRREGVPAAVTAPAPISRDSESEPAERPPHFAPVRSDDDRIVHWLHSLQTGDDDDVAWAVSRLRLAGSPARAAVRSAAEVAVDANPALLQSLGVRTDVSPRDIGASPRLGFRWVYNKKANNNQIYYYNRAGSFSQQTSGVLRGGIGNDNVVEAHRMIADHFQLRPGSLEVRRAGGMGHLDDFEAQLARDQIEIVGGSCNRNAHGKLTMQWMTSPERIFAMPSFTSASEM